MGKTSVRFDQGMKKLMEVEAKGGIAVTEDLGELGRYIVEFAFGDNYSPKGMLLYEREIATIAMLTAMEGRESQLKIHIHADLNIGLSLSEINEVLIQTVPYAGFTAVINGMTVFKNINKELNFNV